MVGSKRAALQRRLATLAVLSVALGGCASGPAVDAPAVLRDVAAALPAGTPYTLAAVGGPGWSLRFTVAEPAPGPMEATIQDLLRAHGRECCLVEPADMANPGAMRTGAGSGFTVVMTPDGASTDYEVRQTAAGLAPDGYPTQPGTSFPPPS
jgi:hypothetical protein